MKSTRTKKRQRVGRDDQDPWDDFWAAVMAAAFAEHQDTATSTQAATKRVQSTNSMSMANVVEAPTTLTVTISTTILSTKFITAPVLTLTNLPPATLTSALPTTFNAAASPSSSRSSTPSWTSTSAASDATGVSSSQTDFPLSATASPAVALESGAANATTDSKIGASAGPSEKRKAIVGGLSASIAALLLIGVVICLVLRQRRRNRPKSRDFGDWSTEKGLRPATLVRKWTGGLMAAVGKGSSNQPTETLPSMATVSGDDEEHRNRIHQMNAKPGVRLVAPAAGEGYRESMPTGDLRVVNPDPSRPASVAGVASDSPSSFMKKQRTALSGLVFGTTRPLSNQRHPPLSDTQISPVITVVDPALWRECAAAYEHTPSFRSYISESSTPTVQPRPVDDSFHAPPKVEGRQPGRHSSATPAQNGVKRHSRALSQLGSQLLHPLRSKFSSPVIQRNPNPPVPDDEISPSSTRSARRSDPFDLDARSVMHSSPNPNPNGAGGSRYTISANGTWKLYPAT